MTLNKNFFNYPTHSEYDKEWGVVLSAYGQTIVAPNSHYPPLQHPKSHEFSVKRLRRITEYQIVYITNGEGHFKCENGINCGIKAGTIFLLFPGVLHQYYPNKHTGWTEYYVGIKGHFVDSIFNNGFILAEKPILEIGIHEELVQLYNEIFEVLEKGMMGCQQTAAGMVWHLLSKVLFLEKNKLISTSIERLIKSVKIYASEKIAEKIDWRQVSSEHGVSYSKLRKEFKAYVGMSPGQFHLQLRINQAKLMLAQTIEPIKYISDSLGFQNEYYFNFFFKKKTGIAPGIYRNLSSGKIDSLS
jgi:AraC-like DNA-binding protein